MKPYQAQMPVAGFKAPRSYALVDGPGAYPGYRRAARGNGRGLSEILSLQRVVGIRGLVRLARARHPADSICAALQRALRPVKLLVASSASRCPVDVLHAVREFLKNGLDSLPALPAGNRFYHFFVATRRKMV